MSFGYSVLAARDVDDAIRLFESRGDSIDLLLTDVVMPRMNGRDLARTLQDERPDLRVVYMSGYADSAIVRGGTLEPGLMFLQKPFTREGLGRKIRDALDV